MDTTSATPMTTVETETRQADLHGAQEQPIRTTRGAPTTMKNITTTGLILTLNTTVNPYPDNLGGTVYLELDITLNNPNTNVKTSTLPPQIHFPRGIQLTQTEQAHATPLHLPDPCPHHHNQSSGKARVLLTRQSDSHLIPISHAKETLRSGQMQPNGLQQKQQRLLPMQRP